MHTYKYEQHFLQNTIINVCILVISPLDIAGDNNVYERSCLFYIRIITAHVATTNNGN